MAAAHTGHLMPPCYGAAAGEHPAAVGLDEFARLLSGLGPWPANRRIAIAVSGGADSLCLAFLAAQWGDPVALVVDHGLRAESTAEAAATSQTLHHLSIPHRVLTLQGLCAGPALAARARAARYAALIVAAGEAGCVDLLLGHHRLDQAETILMRRAAHSGAPGLAGMARIKELHDLRLVRPLLGIPPGRLRSTLSAAGIAWVEDPSNRNPAALRTRLRAALADPEGTAPETAALAEAGQSHAWARRDEERATAETLAERVSVFPEGYALLRRYALRPAAMAALIRMLGGNPYTATTGAVQRLAADPVPAVLGGVRLLPAGRLGASEYPELLVVREDAAMQGAVPALDGTLWDGRFRITGARMLPDGSTVSAVGPDASRLRGCTKLPAAVLSTLPAVRVNGVLAAVPHIGYFAGSAAVRVVVALAPAHPLCGAPFGVHGGCQGGSAPPC